MMLRLRERTTQSVPRAHRSPSARLKRASSVVDDLPERVLPADLAVGELEEVTSADVDVLARHLCPADRPLRDAAVTAGPVAVVAVVDVGDAVEPRLDPCADRLPAGQTTASGRGSTGHVQD